MTRWTSPEIAGKPQEGLNDLYCRRDSHLTFINWKTGEGNVKVDWENVQENKCDSPLLLHVF